MRVRTGRAGGIAIGPIILRLGDSAAESWHGWRLVCGSGRRGDIFGGMAVSVEMHHTGCVPVVRAEIAAIIEHALADRPGDWRVSIIGSQANDRWEMKITGPNAFERSYTLEGSAGEHEPQAIGTLVARMVPGKKD